MGAKDLWGKLVRDAQHDAMRKKPTSSCTQVEIDDAKDFFKGWRLDAVVGVLDDMDAGSIRKELKRQGVI